jgi:PKD repeat protein
MQIRLGRNVLFLVLFCINSLILFCPYILKSQPAPLTTLPTVSTAIPGQVSVPVTVTNFINIGSVSLSFDFQAAVLQYSHPVVNPLMPGFSIGDQDLGNGKHRMVLGCFSYLGMTLTDGSAIITLVFNYIGGGSALEFYDNGASCEYTNSFGDVLNDYPASSFYFNGIVSPLLSANFVANNLTPPKNTTVTLMDLSTGGANSWAWSFNRPGVVYVDGTTSSSQHPKVQFTDGGLYTVTLAVQNGFSTNTLVKTDYIRAGIAGLWTGNSSSDWNTLSNWDNHLIPDGITSVTIPPAAVNWPVFTGNLTLGVHCGTLILDGSTSKMTVTGVLTIP